MTELTSEAERNQAACDRSGPPATQDNVLLAQQER